LNINATLADALGLVLRIFPELSGIVKQLSRQIAASNESEITQLVGEHALPPTNSSTKS
jgi:hypothetical protein